MTDGLAEQARSGQDASEDQEPTPVPLLYAEASVRGLGPVGAAASVAGAVVLARSRPGTALALLAAPAAYLAVMLRGELFAARFALPVVVVAAVLAGGIVRWMPRRGHVVVGLGALLLVVPMVRDVVQHNRLATTTDTRVQAEQWLPPRSHVAAQAYALPPNWVGRPSTEGEGASRFNSLLSPDTERRLECDGTDYVLLASFNYEYQLRDPTNAQGDTGYNRLMQRAEHVQRFSPFADGSWAPAHPDDTAIPFWYMHAYERPGPLIDVYRIPDALRAECQSQGRR